MSRSSQLRDPVKGERFGRWTVLREVLSRDARGRRCVRLRCVCGQEQTAIWSSVLSGQTSGCVSVRCRNAFAAALAASGAGGTSS